MGRHRTVQVELRESRDSAGWYVELSTDEVVVETSEPFESQHAALQALITLLETVQKKGSL